MYSRIIQRILTFLDTEETGALFECLFTHAGNFQQFAAGLERTVLGTVIHDVLRQRWTEAGNISEQMLTGRIDIDTDQVHAAFDSLVETLFQCALFDVVLVLAYADAFRIDLDQFGKRVHQAAADTDGSANRHVVLRELVASYLGCRIDGGAIFADNEHLHLAVVTDVGNELFRLAACRPVADGNCIDGIGRNQLGYFCRSLTLFILGRMRIDGFVVQQRSLCVETDQLTAGPVTGIDSQHTLLSQWRSQQQLAQVLGKHADRFFIGFRLAEIGKFGFDGRLQKTFERVVHGGRNLFGGFIPSPYETAFQAVQAVIRIR